MLYVIYGESKKARSKMKEILAVLHSKQPDAEIINIEPEGFRESQIDELLASQGLFSAKYIVTLENLLEESNSKEYIIEKLKDIAKSEHAFVMIEQKLSATTKKAVTAVAQKVFEIEEKIITKVYDNSFALAEALGARDKQKLWAMYTERITAGEKVEEIHSMLVWQTKSMLLATKCKNATEAGMKEYPFTKAKQFAHNYKPEELENLLFNLVSIYHEAHRGGLELEVAVEKLILEV